MTNAEFLHTYRNMYAELRILEHQLNLCGGDGRPSAADAIDYAKIMRSTNDQAAADRQAFDGVAAEVAALQSQLNSMEPRYEELFRQARNYKERCILRFYYQQGQTDAFVANALVISTRHANRLRQQLLTFLD